MSLVDAQDADSAFVRRVRCLPQQTNGPKSHTYLMLRSEAVRKELASYFNVWRSETQDACAQAVGMSVWDFLNGSVM